MNRRQKRFQYLGWGAVLIGVGLMVLGWLTSTAGPRGQIRVTPTLTSTPTEQIFVTPSATATSVPVSTPTPEPIVPTARPTATPMPSQTPTRVPSPSPTTIVAESERLVTPTSTPESPPTMTATATESPMPSPTSQPATITPAPMSDSRWRVGVSVPMGAPSDYDLDALGVGWVMNWRAYAAPPVPGGVDFAQMVRMKGGQLSLDAGTITAIASANPGAIWLISNEPDVRWQDNVTPETYARLYHDAYHAIKAGDPGAVVTAGGIAQPTPLRLAYLDRAREAYQVQFGAALPVDAWQIHNYMLREARDSWGVDIPPGFSENTGVLFLVDDSGNVATFKQQIYTFRQWMAARGYQGLPLFVTEFGIPMPADYGFPPERVAQYLRETWQFFATAADGSIGNPNDGGRLVQRWCWFSMAAPTYPTGDLVDLETGGWTALGRAWLDWVQ